MCAYCGDKGVLKLGKKPSICPFCKSNKPTEEKTAIKTAKSKTKSTSDILRDAISQLEKRIDYLSVSADNLTAKTIREKKDIIKKYRNEMQYCSAVVQTLRSQAAWI